MNEKSDLGLVLRPSKALEKFDLGTRGVLSGMVADTLALAKTQEIRVRRIVILDDETGMRNLLRHLLLRAFSRLEILEFTEGDAAWSELQHSDPDLLLTDINHFGMNCEEMLSALAQMKAKYPIFVISSILGVRKFKTREESVRASATDLNVTFIAKPFKLDEFLKPVEAALGLRAKPAL